MSNRWQTRIMVVIVLWAGATAFKIPAAQVLAEVSGLRTGDAAKGEDLYKASCTVCHGPRAEGGVGPKLAGNPVLSNDRAFWKVVREGRHVMPPLKSEVTEQQMTDIRAWLRTLP